MYKAKVKRIRGANFAKELKKRVENKTVWEKARHGRKHARQGMKNNKSLQIGRGRPRPLSLNLHRLRKLDRTLKPHRPQKADLRPRVLSHSLHRPRTLDHLPRAQPLDPPCPRRLDRLPRAWSLNLKRLRTSDPLPRALLLNAHRPPSRRR